jgi:toxin HigB-1
VPTIFLKHQQNGTVSIFFGQVPPANRLEKLKGDLQEYHSIRINNQWRIVFQWINNDAYELRIVDYH